MESKAQKDQIIIQGNDIEAVSQSAADIHTACLVKNKGEEIPAFAHDKAESATLSQTSERFVKRSSLLPLLNGYLCGQFLDGIYVEEKTNVDNE